MMRVTELHRELHEVFAEVRVLFASDPTVEALLGKFKDPIDILRTTFGPSGGTTPQAWYAAARSELQNRVERDIGAPLNQLADLLDKQAGLKPPASEKGP